NSKNCRSLLLCVFKCHQCIGGLSTLGNSDDHILVRNNRISIAEFRGIFYLHIQSAKFLDEVFTDESGMPAGTTGHNHNPVCSAEFIFNLIESTECDGSLFGVEPTP